MTENVKFEGWIANLSDGVVAMEYAPEVGKPSAWQTLLARCKEEGLTLKGLRLRKGDIELFAMPHKMCNGYFQASEVAYSFFKQEQVRKQGIGSAVGDTVYITWIDDKQRVYQEVRPLASVKLHTILDIDDDTTRQRSSK